MDEAENDPRLGTLLQGRYQILERLAAGAMGVVYRAERVTLGRKVAIKFLHESFAAESQFLQRFEREARAMSRLAHPHCVSVIDFGVDDAPYVVMDYVQGKTLESLLEAGRLPVSRALNIGRQLLAGLAHAHGKGIIHRDIKPANIMLTEATGTGDHIRILDFGLAKLRGGENDLTMTQVVVGTPSYMSPEQTRGDTVDARSDVYSAGVLLFQLVTGKKPFVADETFEVLRMHREVPAPRLSEAAPDLELSQELQDVVSRAMAKEPDKRYKSAIELSDALEAVPEAQQVSTEGSTINVRRQRPALSVWRMLKWVIVLGALGGGLAYGWPRAKSYLDELSEFVDAGDRAVTTTNGNSLDIAPQPVTEVHATTPAEAADAARPAADARPIAHDASAADASALKDAAPVAHDAAGTGEGAATIPDAGQPAADAAATSGVKDFKEAMAVVEEAIRAAETDNTSVTAPSRKQRVREVDSIADVKALLRQGRREAAISGLNKLRRKYPKSAYVPYLLGHLYFEKLWWTDGMESYREAIRKDRSYRRRAPLIRNVIHALGSDRTRRLATRIILNDIGRPAIRHLRRAAKHDDNRKVRQRAAWLARRLSR